MKFLTGRNLSQSVTWACVIRDDADKLFCQSTKHGVHVMGPGKELGKSETRVLIFVISTILAIATSVLLATHVALRIWGQHYGYGVEWWPWPSSSLTAVSTYNRAAQAMNNFLPLWYIWDFDWHVMFGLEFANHVSSLPPRNPGGPPQQARSTPTVINGIVLVLGLSQDTFHNDKLATHAYCCIRKPADENERQ